jgi:hypothetical protein
MEAKSLPNLRYYPGICLQGLRRTTKISWYVVSGLRFEPRTSWVWSRSAWPLDHDVQSHVPWETKVQIEGKDESVCYGNRLWTKFELNQTTQEYGPVVDSCDDSGKHLFHNSQESVNDVDSYWLLREDSMLGSYVWTHLISNYSLLLWVYQSRPWVRDHAKVLHEIWN